MLSELQLSQLAHNLLKHRCRSVKGEACTKKPWEKVVLALGSSKADVYKHKEENKYNDWAQCFNALIQWQRHFYKNATADRVVAACRQCDITHSAYEFLLPKA